MQFDTYYPSAGLRPFVRSYTFPEIDHTILHQHFSSGLVTYPQASVSLVVFFSEPSIKVDGETKTKLHYCSLAGYNTRPKRFLRDTALRQMIITFTPIGIQQLLDFSLQDVCDAHARVEYVFKGEGSCLTEELQYCTDNISRVRVVEQLLLKKYHAIKSIDTRVVPLLARIMQQGGTESIGALSAYSSLGQRTIQRLVHRYTGINYKLLTRLVRFDAAKSMLQHDDRERSLTDIAYSLGYYDQAHFIHDFSSMAGQTPGSFQKTGIDLLRATSSR